jgi:hypothetical protein
LVATILLVVVFRIELHKLGVSGWSESSSTSRSAAAVARASTGRGQTGTKSSCEWRVTFLVWWGAKSVLWFKL